MDIGALCTDLSLLVEALSLRLRMGSLVEKNSVPALLSKLSEGQAKAAPLDACERALARADALVAYLPHIPATCLYRSLTRYALLRHAGHPARFVMAIEPPKEPCADLSGHAWVELQGEPLGEDIDTALVVTYAYPEASV